MSLFLRTKVFWIIAFICAACGTIATPLPTPTLVPRPVAMTIQPDPILTQTPLFDPKFSVEVRQGRNLEGFCVWTNQLHYWEPGDITETAQPHTIEITIDDEQVFSRDDLFIFWNNASIQEVFDDEGNLLGSYLASGMSICFSTRTLSLGSHHGTIEITSSSGVIHSYRWDFELTSITRTEIDPSLVPTADYLLSNPAPTPAFIQRAPSAVGRPDHFICETSFGEALLIMIDRDTLVGMDRGPLSIHMMIDQAVLPSESIPAVSNDNPHAIVFCADTGYFETGIHIATIQIMSLSGIEQSYSWAFRIE